MIIPQTYYAIRCDHPGCEEDTSTVGDDYTAWGGCRRSRRRLEGLRRAGRRRPLRRPALLPRASHRPGRACPAGRPRPADRSGGRLVSATLLHEARPKARKSHRCSLCTGLIKPGETYQRDTLVFDGRVYDCLTCPRCETDEISDHPDPRCEVHDDDQPITCGWKRLSIDLLNALGLEVRR